MVEANLQEFIGRGAESNRSSAAICSPDRPSLSFQNLNVLIDETELALTRLGITRSDRVCIVLPTGPEMATCCLAVACSAVCAPLNPDYRLGEFEQLFKNLAPTLLITAPGVSLDAREAAQKSGVAVVELMHSPTADAGWFELDLAATQTLTRRGKATERERDAAGPDDTALVLHTSGSTALPKIVPLTHRNLTTSARNLAASLALGSDDHGLNMMPLYHVGALVDLLLAPLSVGGSVTIASSMSSSVFFDCLDSATQPRPTWYQGVPTMLQDIVATAKHDGRPAGNNSLRFARAVSAPLPDRVLQEFEEMFHVPVIEIYGMTETAGVITSNPLPPHVRKSGSVGIPAGPEVSILDEGGNPARPGDRGEVVVRGHNVMAGYEGDDALNEDGFVGTWLRTGDEGYFDADRYLFLTGRIKEIINRGGEKISPREIDVTALTHPEVYEAATFPIAHASLGEDVAIAVVRYPNRTSAEASNALTERGLIDYLSSRLAYFKVPRTVFFVAALPVTAGGKLRRHALAAQYGELKAVPERAEWVAPETPIARQLAAMWERALGVSSIGLHDNFFDLGGDSLKAATFMREFIDEQNCTLPISTLFDAPTVASFEVALGQAGQGANAEPGMDDVLATGLPVSIHRELGTYLAAWRGTRATGDALLVGRNMLGSKQPLFWCCNAFETFATLAAQLGADQPVFGMRTLRHLEQNNEENLSKITAHYAHEISQLQPEGPILLGGFCTGGKIAFDIAQHLVAQGREISNLFLQEVFVPMRYAGRVSMFFCSRDYAGRHSPYKKFLNPELGWLKFYSGDVSVRTFDWRHREYYHSPNVEIFAAQLQDEIAASQSPESCSSHRAQRPPEPLQQLSADSYRAKIEASPRRFYTPGATATVRVKVTNLGEQAWKPTAQSGLVLCNRWRNRKGNIWLDGSTSFVQEVAPGASVRMDVQIEASTRRGHWMLYFDVVDQGVTWFGAAGSLPHRRNVWITNLQSPFASRKIDSNGETA